jgi:putative endonuclease
LSPRLNNKAHKIERQVLRLHFASEVTGRRYVGSCQELADRLRRHNAGESKSTRHGIPWKVVFRKTFASRAEAVLRERYFKTGQVREELDGVESVAQQWHC